MPISRTPSFRLMPHPTTAEPLVRGIGGEVSRAGDDLRVSYHLDGDTKRLRLPPPRPPRFADGLWRHTCFELFIGYRGQPQYHEFNFSPSGEWAVYAFTNYRQGLPLEPATVAPRISVCRSGGVWSLEARIALPHPAAAGIVLGLSAVVESLEDRLSYWALGHPCSQPDFHHADTFLLELDEIRN